MKKILLLLSIVFGTATLYSQDLYKAIDGSIAFFSETPMENIDAVNKTLKALLNTKNGEMAFVVTNVGFVFDKPLMGEHFNENYMESDKYKVSIFKGKITETIDYTKNGEHDVTVLGSLDVHGVSQERSITGKVLVKDGTIILNSNFDIKLKDHKIKIPKIVTENIAEFVNVKVNITLTQKK